MESFCILSQNNENKLSVILNFSVKQKNIEQIEFKNNCIFYATKKYKNITYHETLNDLKEGLFIVYDNNNNQYKIIDVSFLIADKKT